MEQVRVRTAPWTAMAAVYVGKLPPAPTDSLAPLFLPWPQFFSFTPPTQFLLLFFLPVRKSAT